MRQYIGYTAWHLVIVVYLFIHIKNTYIYIYIYTYYNYACCFFFCMLFALCVWYFSYIFKCVPTYTCYSLLHHLCHSRLYQHWYMIYWTVCNDGLVLNTLILNTLEHVNILSLEEVNYIQPMLTCIAMLLICSSNK